jgi:hypothetical protein
MDSDFSPRGDIIVVVVDYVILLPYQLQVCNSLCSV